MNIRDNHVAINFGRNLIVIKIELKASIAPRLEPSPALTSNKTLEHTRDDIQ